MSNSNSTRPLSYYINMYVVIFLAIAVVVMVSEAFFIK
jgi:hypothetical protein